MLGAALREIERGFARAAARVVLPVVTECLRILAEDQEDEKEEIVLRDARSTVYGQFEAASNRDHDTDEIFAFGFGKK